MRNSKIEWCDDTFNPVTGCLHGCEYCYARGIATRFGGNALGINVLDERLLYAPVHFPYALGINHVLNEPFVAKGKIQPYPMGFYPTFHRYRLNDYIRKKGRNIFVCSMGDLFGKWVPDSWIVDVINTCLKNPDNNYLFLTKNPKRYREYYIPRDCVFLWFGTTVTRKNDIPRVYELAHHRNTFVSIEPILEDLELRCDRRFFLCVDWVIIGAETGRRKNKIIPKKEWIEGIVKECRKANIPIFMKSSLDDIWGEPLIQEFPPGLTQRSHL